MRRILFFCLVALLAATSQAMAQTAEPFGVTLKTTFKKGEKDYGWQKALQNVPVQLALVAQCRRSMEDCPASFQQAASSFIEITDDSASHTGKDRIGWLNKRVNLLIEPINAGCGADVWTLSLSTATGCANCKVETSWKYLGLLELGFPASDLRIVVGRNTRQGGEHALVAVRFRGQWIILDNSYPFILVTDTEKQGFLADYSLEVPASLVVQASN